MDAISQLERARTLMARAGVLFQELGQPFGLYLSVISGQAQDSSIGFASEALLALRADDDRPGGPAVQHPQQQAYLVVAMAGMAPTGERLEGLSGVIRNSVHNDGVVPVGAIITRNGRDAAIVISVADLAELEESILPL